MNAVRKMPPLNALRAFEAAARCKSFKGAASELSVTSAAISHQISTWRTSSAPDCSTARAAPLN